VVPVHGPDHGQVGRREQERLVVQVGEPVGPADGRQVLLVDAQRVPAGVVGADPDVVVAGDGGLAAREVVEQGQAAGEVVAGPDVAGQDEQIGGVFGEPGGEVEGGLVPRGVPGAVMQVGGDRDPER